MHNMLYMCTIYPFQLVIKIQAGNISLKLICTIILLKRKELLLQYATMAVSTFYIVENSCLKSEVHFLYPPTYVQLSFMVYSFKIF
jgi:hypothetical protein